MRAVFAMCFSERNVKNKSNFHIAYNQPTDGLITQVFLFAHKKYLTDSPIETEFSPTMAEIIRLI